MQYPPGTTKVYSYFESRGGKFPSTVFFGLQYILKRWMIGQVLTREKIEEARDFYQMHFGSEIFNEAGWLYILEVGRSFFSSYGSFLPSLCLKHIDIWEIPRKYLNDDYVSIVENSANSMRMAHEFIMYKDSSHGVKMMKEKVK